MIYNLSFKIDDPDIVEKVYGIDNSSVKKD